MTHRLRQLRQLLMTTSVGLLGACAADPVYFAAEPPAVEINVPDREEEPPPARLVVPVRAENEAQRQGRHDLADELMLESGQVPHVRRDVIDVSLEWTVKNLTDEETTASLSILGANEYVRYDPEAFVIDPEEDQAPPPLLGGKPITLGPFATVSGVVREDEVWEAAQDLDAVARAGVTPQAALLTRWPSSSVEASAGGPMVPGGELMRIPSQAIPALLAFDVSLVGREHLVLEVTLRVRDRSGRLISDPEDDSERIEPSDTAVVPAAPEEPAP